MSLHIGWLSLDVQQKYLEDLFQRFGHCTVNLKDGYGFAVYDSNADAARAMRALRGKYVCGERITVNWSKQQPRFSQGFRRSSRFVESSHGRTFRDGGDNIRSRDSLAQMKHPASPDQSHNPDAAPEKESDKFTEGVNDAGEKIGEDPVEVKRDEDGTIDANAIEHDRWPETGKGSPGGDGDDFDRYEPYHGYDRQEETENVVKANSYDSHDHRHSSEKWHEHSDKRVDVSHDKSRSPPTCYTCGVSGHIARNCPQEIDGKFKARRDGLNFREKWELRQRRFGSPARRRPEYHVYPMDQTYHRVQDVRRPFSERNRRVPRLSDVSKENRRQATKEARKRNRSQRSRGSSVSSEPSKYHREDNIKGSHSKQTSSDSQSRSPRCSSRLRAHSPSYSAQSSSESSQPTQHEKSRSNTNHPVPYSVSASPQRKSSLDVENKNLDVMMSSPLEDNLDVRTSEVKHIDDNKQEVKGSAMSSQVPVTSFNMNTLGHEESLVREKDVKAGYTGVDLDENLVGDYADIVANGVQSQNANSEDPSSVKSNQDVLAKHGRSKSLKLTTNEVISALKHYGMEAQEVHSSDQPVEKYFGAARLWPWQIIYYRPLKKGSISTENYAKRLEQNKEFGIVDQYVRRSSGWWECH